MARKKKSKVKKVDKEKRLRDLEADYKKWMTYFVDENKKKITHDEYVKKFGNPFRKKEVR